MSASQCPASCGGPNRLIENVKHGTDAKLARLHANGTAPVNYSCSEDYPKRIAAAGQWHGTSQLQLQ